MLSFSLCRLVAFAQLIQKWRHGLLPDNSFLRNAPRVIDLRSRLQWEVLVNASDAMWLSYRRLKIKLRKAGDSTDLFVSEKTRSATSVDCWSIVDNAHAYLQIVRSLNLKKGGNHEALLKNFGATISKIRNGMDHIHQQISNMAHKKGGKYPLFGTVGFCTKLRQPDELEWCPFPLGGMQFNEQFLCPFDSLAVPSRDCVSQICFSAFDKTLSISKLIAEIRFAIREMSKDVKRQVYPLIVKTAKEYKTDITKIMLETVKGAIIVKMKLVRD
jgi:hypothetical protein